MFDSTNECEGSKTFRIQVPKADVWRQEILIITDKDPKKIRLPSVAWNKGIVTIK